MAEEAKDSPGKAGAPPFEFPESALDLLKELTDGKPGTRETDGWKTWAEIGHVKACRYVPESFSEIVNFT